jgi:hypothetical protein
LKKEREKLKGEKQNNSFGRFSGSLPTCPEPVEGLPAGQSFANSVPWENRQKNVLGFVEQSSFFTQLRYGVRNPEP